MKGITFSSDKDTSKSMGRIFRPAENGSSSCGNLGDRLSHAIAYVFHAQRAACTLSRKLKGKQQKKEQNLQERAQCVSHFGTAS